jgi:hypothetical protein
MTGKLMEERRKQSQSGSLGSDFMKEEAGVGEKKLEEGSSGGQGWGGSGRRQQHGNLSGGESESSPACHFYFDSALVLFSGTAQRVKAL